MDPDLSKEPGISPTELGIDANLCKINEDLHKQRH